VAPQRRVAVMYTAVERFDRDPLNRLFLPRLAALLSADYYVLGPNDVWVKCDLKKTLVWKLPS